LKRIFIETQEFSKKWKSLGMSDSDLRELQNYLLEKPDAGKIIKGTGGIRKVRWARNKGKSGGIRSLYIDFTKDAKLYFITVFGKNEKDNISDHEKNLIKKFVQTLKK
jgi:hypothetical protein